MAAPTENDSDSTDSDRIPEFVDPRSPKFDPRRALYDTHTPTLFPDARQFNNVSEFENYLKGKDCKSLQMKKVTKRKQSGIIAVRAAAEATELVRKSAILAKNAGPSIRSKAQERRNQSTNVFTRMEGYTKGPLSLLQHCVEERLRVIVNVRAAVAVRSRCRGYVVAFDKHFNMALMDVDEKFIRPVARAKNEKNKLKEEEQSKEDLLAEKTNRLSVHSSNPCDGLSNRDRNTHEENRRSDADKYNKVPDLGVKLKQSKCSSENVSQVSLRGRSRSKDKYHNSSRSRDFHYDSQRSTTKASSGEASSSEHVSDKSIKLKDSYDRRLSSNEAKVEHSRSPKDSSSERSRTLVSSEKRSSSKSSDQRSGSNEYSGSLRNKSNHESEQSEDKMLLDCKVHSRNYTSDSNVYIERQQNRLQGNKSAKSDGDQNPEYKSTDRLKKVGKDLKRHFQPFWPLYMKWTEARCYAKYEMVTRHVNQLFIRGDNVVSVSIADC